MIEKGRKRAGGSARRGKFFPLLLAAGMSWGLAGCESGGKEAASPSGAAAQEPAEAGQSPGGESNADGGALALVQATLPKRIGTEGSCEAPNLHPTLCAWADSVDAIVVGTVIETAAVLSPAVQSNPQQSPNWALVESCESYAGIGIKIVILPDSWLRGGPLMEPITVYVGTYQLDLWAGLNSAKLVTDENPAGWLHPEHAPLEPGTTIGLAITKDPTVDLWSLMGEHPFTFDSTGVLIMEEYEDCVFNPPPIPSEMTLSEFVSDLENCAALGVDPDGAWRLETRLSIYTSSPLWSYASRCSQSEGSPAPFPFCYQDEQCEDGETCEGGTCNSTSPD